MTESELAAKDILEKRGYSVFKTNTPYPDFLCIDGKNKISFVEVKGGAWNFTKAQKRSFRLLHEAGCKISIMQIKSGISEKYWDYPSTFTYFEKIVLNNKIYGMVMFNFSHFLKTTYNNQIHDKQI